MKRIGISVTDPTDWTGVAFQNSVTRCGMDALAFSFSEATSNILSGKLYSKEIDLTTLDAVIVRDLGPSTRNDVSFRFDILCQLEELGITVINSPGSIARSANKYVSSYMFRKNGINTPETLVTNCQEEAFDALSSFGRAVVKPVFGYKGIGVECVKNNERGRQKLKALLEKNGLVYIQEFIPNPGRDIRVFVVDNKVMGSIYRIAPEGSWINNLSQGGSARPCILTGEQEKLSLEASKIIGTTYAGVDIIEGDKPYVIEINGTPSGKGIFEACGVDVTIDIIEYIKNLIK
ncbi:MAG: RimK family alpha-L-glutamate ligase [Candidatus Methanoperedens sp.]|nr:RimK family alpha-L-glutamate ligase [Candidatus Methanoperedens sp.]